MQLMLLEITRAPVFSRSMQFGMQFLEIARRVLREAFQLQLFQNLSAFGLRQIGEKDFTNSCTVQRHRRSNTRVNAQRFWRIKFFDVNGGQSVADRQMNCFSREMIQFLQVRQTGRSNIKLSSHRLANETHAIPKW